MIIIVEFGRHYYWTKDIGKTGQQPEDWTWWWRGVGVQMVTVRVGVLSAGGSECILIRRVFSTLLLFYWKLCKIFSMHPGPGFQDNKSKIYYIQNKSDKPFDSPLFTLHSTIMSFWLRNCNNYPTKDFMGKVAVIALYFEGSLNVQNCAMSKAVVKLNSGETAVQRS